MANKKMNPLDEKCKKDNLKFNPIRNKDLVCRECAKAFDDTDNPGNVSRCEAFRIKPIRVIDGGECLEFEPKR